MIAIDCVLPEEALEKVCVNNRNAICISKSCMAWRWELVPEHDDTTKVSMQPFLVEYTRSGKGYCGLIK